MKSLKDLYVYCPYCTGKLVSRDSYKQCQQCHRQYYFNPKPTVSVMLTDDTGGVLLTKRAVEPYKGWWDLPGGFVESGETLEAAASREIYEETGLRIGDLQYVGSFIENYDYRGDTYPLVAVLFAGRLPEGGSIQVGDDVEGYKVIAMKDIDLAEVAFENQRRFLVDYFKTVG